MSYLTIIAKYCDNTTLKIVWLHGQTHTKNVFWRMSVWWEKFFSFIHTDSILKRKESRDSDVWLIDVE